MSIRLAKRPKVLDELIETAKQRAQSRPLKVCFDLDSTLFDVSPRIAKVLHDFAELPEIRQRYPNESQRLLAIKPHPSDYGVKRTLQRCQFPMPEPEFIKKLIHFWRDKFFSDPYIRYDWDYPGAVSFVQDLWKAGAHIIYISGRDVPRMQEGTLAQIKAHHLPSIEDGAELILKPESRHDDAGFKRDFFQNILTEPDVWLFENEPKNILPILADCRHVTIVYVQTVHAEESPEPPAHLIRIKGFVEE